MRQFRLSAQDRAVVDELATLLAEMAIASEVLRVAIRMCGGLVRKARLDWGAITPGDIPYVRDMRTELLLDQELLQFPGGAGDEGIREHPDHLVRVLHPL